MRLSCPSCQTEYDVPDAALTGRSRTLRCVQCGYQWQAAPRDGLRQEPPAPVAVAFTPVAAAPLPAVPIQAAPKPLLEPSAFADSWPQPERDPPGEPLATRARRLPVIDPEPAARGHEDETRERFAALVESSRQNNLVEEHTPVAKRPGVKRRPNPILISVLILLVAVIFVWIERAHIIQAWPPSGRLFNAISRLIR